MFVLYNIALFLFCLFYLPIFFLKKKSGDHLGERFGSVPEKRGAGKVFWLHAVSLGEALAASEFVKDLRIRFPSIRFAFSTTTRTGRLALEKIRARDDTLFYVPLDFGSVVERALERIKPDYFATMETEIWPNLIYALKRARVPIFLLNGRISKKSFRRYRWVRWALSTSLEKIDLFCMQYPEDGDRIRQLGAPPEKIHVVGNMKFDLTLAKEEVPLEALREKLGLLQEEKLWVAGSTHPGEEKALLEVYTILSRDHPTLRMLIAPRHPERTKEVVKLIATFHREASLFSENGKPRREPSSIFVLDTVGQLKSLYQAADFVFIGGSLVPKGGQNLLEPAFYGKPVLFGPYMDNFRDIVSLFLKKEAAIQVENQEELAHATRLLLEDEALRRSLGEKARELILENQGVVRRHLELVERFLS